MKAPALKMEGGEIFFISVYFKTLYSSLLIGTINMIALVIHLFNLI
jgi:hypothetical protein